MSQKSSNESSESDPESEGDEYKPPRKKTKNYNPIDCAQTPVKAKTPTVHTCQTCKKGFTNKGNLVAHATKMHNSIGVSEIPKVKRVKCQVCDTEVPDTYSLKFHIRRAHYNLKSKIPSFELKKVNQVWFEKVINSDAVMELKKTGENVLVMRKLGPNTAIKVMDSYTPEIDLTTMYLTTKQKQKKGKKCPYCNKIFLQRSFKKHLEEKHLNLARHKCNNCNVRFKRLYQYLKHVCFVSRRRVKKKGDLIIIDDA